MQKEVTLVSLAMLKIKEDGGSDYLDYLKPFIKHILSKWDTTPVDETKISESLKNTHGLIIPSKVVQIVLKRLTRDGVLYKQNGLFFVAKGTETPEWVTRKAGAEKNITFIAKALIEFAKENIGKEIDESIAIDCFIDFLSKFSIPCLKNFLRNTALPEIPKNGDWRIILVSEFVKYIDLNSPEKFDAFMILAQGHMLANALLCPDLSSLKANYRDVTFYFDTAILLNCLGLNGPEKQASLSELLSLVKNLGGELAYFSHTLVELKTVIGKAADFIDSYEGRGSVIFNARQSGTTRSDLLLAAEKADEALARMGLECRDTPRYFAEYQIDETAFENLLDEELSYLNPRAKEHDINSLRSIYVLRKGASPVSLERCKAVFVTSNGRFANASQEYCKKVETSSEVSPVITDFSLINISWLKAPMGAPTLPKKEILSFSYAALVPSREFWDKVIDEAEKITRAGELTERNHQLLRSSPAALSELVKMTLGDDENLSSASIKETLIRVTDEIRQEEKEKILGIESEKNELKKQLETQIEQTDSIKKKIFWNVDRRIKTEARIVSALVATLIFFVAALSVFKSDISNIIMQRVSYTLPILLSLGSYFTTIKDTNLRTLYYAKMFEKRLSSEYSKIGLPEND